MNAQPQDEDTNSRTPVMQTVRQLGILSDQVAFYERLGFQSLPQPVLIQQPIGRIPSPVPVMAYPAERVSGLDGALELGSAPW